MTLAPPTSLAASRATDTVLMATVCVLAGVVAVTWGQAGELIAARDGIGYDGAVYAGVVRAPGEWLAEATISHHRVQRVLPSLVVHLVLRPLGLHESTTAIIVAFQVLNFGMMAVGAAVWTSIARRLDLSRPAAWFGFVALVGNYALLKFAGYYPVLTDTAGWFLGLCLLWAAVHRRRTALLLVSVAAAFTWPTVLYSGLVLFAASRPTSVGHASRRWSAAGAAILAGAVSVSALVAWQCGTDCVAPIMTETTVEELLPVSVAVLATWIFLATRPLLQHLQVSPLLRAIDVPRAVVAVAVLLGVSLMQARLSQPSELTLLRTLQNISLGSIAKPAGFVVAGTTFFGPALLLTIAWWRRVVPRLAEHGPVLVAVMVGYVVLAVDLEARKFMNVWPFVAAFTAAAVDRVGWRGRQVAWFAVLSLVASRVWLPLNHGELTGDRLAYPDQLYFMSMGPRMSPLSFLLMLGVSVVIGALLWLIHRRASHDAGTAARGGDPVPPARTRSPTPGA